MSEERGPVRFTWEDVDALDGALVDMSQCAQDRATMNEHGECHAEWLAVESVRDRIAALLPPREDREAR